jgi:hypothetical protein
LQIVSMQQLLPCPILSAAAQLSACKLCWYRCCPATRFGIGLWLRWEAGGRGSTSIARIGRGGVSHAWRR